MTTKCTFRHRKFSFFKTSSVLNIKVYQNSLKSSHVNGEDGWEISIFWEQSDFSKTKILTQTTQIFKVHIFWEGHKILHNLHLRFDHYYIEQIYSGDFTNFLWPSQIIWTLTSNSKKKKKTMIIHSTVSGLWIVTVFFWIRR